MHRRTVSLSPCTTTARLCNATLAHKEGAFWQRAIVGFGCRSPYVFALNMSRPKHVIACTVHTWTTAHHISVCFDSPQTVNVQSKQNVHNSTILGRRVKNTEAARHIVTYTGQRRRPIFGIMRGPFNWESADSCLFGGFTKELSTRKFSYSVSGSI